MWGEGTNSDCAIFALWLRGRLPPEVPLIASDNDYRHTAVISGMTVLDLLQRMLLDMQEHDRAERAWADATMEPVPGGWRTADGSIYVSAEGLNPPKAADLDLPLSSMDEPVIAAAVREHLYRLLGKEADQFFAPDDDQLVGSRITRRHRNATRPRQHPANHRQGT